MCTHFVHCLSLMHIAFLLDYRSLRTLRVYMCVHIYSSENLYTQKYLCLPYKKLFWWEVLSRLRIEEGGLGVKCYALFNELSIFCCKENICLLYIHKSHFKDQFNDVFIFIMYKLKSV